MIILLLIFLFVATIFFYVREPNGWGGAFCFVLFFYFLFGGAYRNGIVPVNHPVVVMTEDGVVVGGNKKVAIFNDPKIITAAKNHQLKIFQEVSFSLFGNIVGEKELIAIP